MKTILVDAIGVFVNEDASIFDEMRKMLEHFSLSAEDVVYFEHNKDAAKSASSIGILTHYYDSDKRDLDSLKKFLADNL